MPANRSLHRTSDTPPVVQSNVRTVPYSHVAIVTHFAGAAGIAVDPLLERAGLVRDLFEAIDARAPADRYTELLLSIAAHRDDPSFWLELGRHYTFPAIGDVGLLLQSCQSPRDALPRLCRYYEIVSCGTALNFQIDGDASVHLDKSYAAHPLESRIKSEFMAGSFRRNSALLVGDDTPFLRFEFDYPEPAGVQAYHTVLGKEVSFGHSRCRFIVPEGHVDRPYTLANATMRSALTKRCDDTLGRVGTSPPLHQRVRNAVANTPGLDPTLAQVAATLGIGTRTLSRQLSQDGVRFDVIRREVQYRRARDLLGATTMTISEIAPMVGFDNASNFTRAFVRWSGATPTEFRRGPAAGSVLVADDPQCSRGV